MYVFNLAPQLQVFDTRFLHNQEIHQAVMVFQKKSMYYNMKVKSYKRMQSSTNKFLQKAYLIRQVEYDKAIKQIEQTVAHLRNAEALPQEVAQKITLCRFNIKKIEWEKKDMEQIYKNIQWELEKVVYSLI